MSKEAMKLAWEAEEKANPQTRYNSWCRGYEAALREALAKPDFWEGYAPEPVKPAQQEPVARQYQSRDGVWKDFISEKHYKDTLEDGSWPIRNLYISPPAQRTWVGLEKSDMPDGADPLFDDPKFIAGMVYAANKLMEKNNG